MRTFCIALVFFTLCAHAADKPLYRFVDAQGGVHFSDKPPGKNARPFVINPLDRPDALTPAPASAVNLPATPRFAVHFDTPTPGQIYPASVTEIPVSMSVMPGLIRGFGLRLKVDGVNSSDLLLRDIHTTLHDLGAGSHIVVALLINAKGQELTRSAPLKIHIRNTLLPKN